MRRATAFAILVCCALPSASAQYASTFEAMNGTAAGMPLAGQDDFYVPPVGGIDGACYTYTDNALGIVPHPSGGEHFIAVKRGVSSFARVEHAVSMPDETCWVHEFDFCLRFVGTLPTENYAGSYSLQPFPGAGSLVVLFYWDDPETAETFSIRVLGHDEDGGVPYEGGIPVGVPGFDEFFHGLPANNWHKLGLRLEFRRNTLSAVSIQNLTTEAPAFGFVPEDLTGYYLGGGEMSDARPAAFRFYAGGGFATDHIPGNTLAIDNMLIVPTGETDCFADITFDRVVDINDLAFLLSRFGLVSGAFFADGDLDCDGDVDIDDLALMLANFGTFCN